MGVRADYASVNPVALAEAQDETGTPEGVEARVEGFVSRAFNETDNYYGSTKQWDTLWWIVDPSRRDDVGGPGNALGYAVVGARYLNPRYTRLFESPEYGGVMDTTRCLTADEVADASDALALFNIRGAFDPAELAAAGGYFNWSRGRRPRPSDYKDYVLALQHFYRRAAAQREAVVITIG